MIYANMAPLRGRLEDIDDYSRLAAEYGYIDEARQTVAELEVALAAAVDTLKKFTVENETDDEPSCYDAIRKLCPGGNSPVKNIPDLHERMTGAVLGRFAGCVLGAPVEMRSPDEMELIAKYAGVPFPPRDYWPVVAHPWRVHYGVDTACKYSRDGMDGVPVDDDITYTILGLLIIEKYGFDFTVEQVAEIWLDLLPYACTAEDVALKNLKKGIPAREAAIVDNKYLQWIGADIRADGFGYAAAGNPQKAAKMGYVDAYLTHRRNGIYGEMYFAAAIAAAFTVNDPIEALNIALREIPATCALYKDIEWALEVGPNIKDYRHARDVVDERFDGMSQVHTNNNACLTVFGLFLGEGDFTKTIGNVIAMGLDNDCTGATVGSIIGAVVGEKGIPQHWTKPFNDKVRTYLNGMPEFSIRDVIARFVRLANM